MTREQRRTNEAPPDEELVGLDHHTTTVEVDDAPVVIDLGEADLDLDILDREATRAVVRDLARDLLDGEFTTETREWEDGDFQVVAYHTIDATYPREAWGRGEEGGLPYYRERVAFDTHTPGTGVYLEVVRRRCGRTGHTVVSREPVGSAGVHGEEVA